LLCETHHGKQVYEHIGMFAEDVVGLTAQLCEFGKLPGSLPAHHVGKVWRKDKRGTLPLISQFLFVITQKMTKVDIWDEGKAGECPVRFLYNIRTKEATRFSKHYIVVVSIRWQI